MEIVDIHCPRCGTVLGLGLCDQCHWASDATIEEQRALDKELELDAKT
jgi:hypothetical protein